MALNYAYKGDDGIPVRVVKFYDLADYIFSFEQWKNEGGWRGLIKINAFNLRDVEKVVIGKMDPVEFDDLQPWEG